MLPKTLAVLIVSWLIALSPVQRATFYGQNASSTPGLNPCLVSAWAMNEGSGLTLNDSAPGGTNTATINTGSSVTWTTNSIKTGVVSPVWNASGFALTTNTTLENFPGTQAFSVSAWVNPLSNTEQTFFGTLNMSAGDIGWELEQNSSGQTDFILIDSVPSGNYLIVNGNLGALSGSLHYIVATYDGSKTAAGVHIYRDGVAESTTIAHDNLTSSATGSGLPVRFAGRTDGTDKYSGAMAYAEVYNCALTPTQIATYNAAGPGIY